MELAPEISDLIATQLSASTATAVVVQSGKPVLEIRPTPLHQAGSSATRNGLDLGHGIAQAIKANRLHSATMQPISGPMLGRHQGVCRLVGQVERTVCHA